LYALQHVRELMWRCTDIVCALRAMDASAAHGGTHAAVQQLLDGQDACIVDAAAAAFRSVADRLSPAACHPLHHFAMEHGWFRSGHADDSVMVTTRLLHHLLMVLQGLQSVSAIGIDSVSVSTGVSASSLEWCMEAHMRCSNARCAATARQSFSLPSPSVVLNGEAGRVVEVATAFDAARSSLWAFGRPACDACGVGSLHVHDCVAVGAATPVVLMHLAAGGFAFDEVRRASLPQLRKRETRPQPRVVAAVIIVVVVCHWCCCCPGCHARYRRRAVRTIRCARGRVQERRRLRRSLRCRVPSRRARRARQRVDSVVASGRC
jgi:hypothetical protein